MNLEELYLLYMKTADPTEYRFAVRACGSWREWEAMAGNDPIKGVIDGWRRELESKLRSEALYRIMEVAGNEGTRDSLQANKYLLEANFSNKDKVGRPSKQDALVEARKMMDHKEQVEDDFKRLFDGSNTPT